MLFSCGNDDWQIDNKIYKFEKIASNIFVIHGSTTEPNKINQSFMNNPVLIVGKNALIIIDAGTLIKLAKKS